MTSNDKCMGGGLHIPLRELLTDRQTTTAHLLHQLFHLHGFIGIIDQHQCCPLTEVLLTVLLNVMNSEHVQGECITA